MTVVEYDVAATMRDGVVLRADVYRPSGAGRWPVLLVRTPYDKRDPVILGLLDPLAATRRGFLVVVQDVRGRFGSDGEWAPVVNESADGYDTVRWAARLPGAIGRVGTYGPSYLGQVQLAALAAHPPELAAAAVAFTWADPYDGFVARGGAGELGLVTNWSLRQGFDVLRRRGADPRRIVEALDAFDAGPDPAVLNELGLPAPMPPVFAPAHAPTLVIAGWYDPFLQGSLDTYAAVRSAGLPAALIVGPWTHNNHTGHIGDVTFGIAADAASLDLGASLWTRQMDWLGRDDHEDGGALVYVMGANAWRRFAEWPPESKEVSWYLHDHGVLRTEPPAGRDADVLRYDTANPVPARGGPLLISPGFEPGPVDQRPIEDRPDVLLYTSDPLTEPLTVLGRIRATLVASGGTDVVVRLCDVHPGGTSIPVADGIRRTRDTGPREVDLWSTAHVFRPGHRLRLHVTWSSYPRWDLPAGGSTGLSIQRAGSRLVLPVSSARN